MDTQIFESSLNADGYREIETKHYEPRPANGEHGHHFSVRGLILEGDFTVTLEGQPTTYRTGDVFEVAEGRLHFEEIGPAGVKLMVGKKY